MLYRVENLSKSGDKRMQSFPSYKRREKGFVGTIVEIPGKGYEGLFWLAEASGNFGVYRSEELEEVTEKQLQLETDLAALLTIFPNEFPASVLYNKVPDEFDVFAVETLVPLLRKRYKKEFVEQKKVIKKLLSLFS